MCAVREMVNNDGTYNNAVLKKEVMRVLHFLPFTRHEIDNNIDVYQDKGADTQLRMYATENVRDGEEYFNR